MKRWTVFLLAVFFLLSHAVAQDSRSSVSVNAGAVLNHDSGSAALDQNPTDSFGLLFNYRLALSRHNGLEVNYGYTRNTQKYASGSATVQAGVHEFTVGYVFRVPLGRLVPFVNVGGGAMLFHPTDGRYNLSVASTQTRPALLYGVGGDYAVSKHFGFRLQFRNLLYEAPDFNVSSISSSDVTQTIEPALGLVLNF